ncbi:MAG: hypothetical protein AAGF93_15925 [Cyanobacteria bacterium P01_H01_bin.105]
MPFLPLFIVIGIFLATSKILQPSPKVQKQTDKQSYGDFEDQALSLALIDYISRESKKRNNSDGGHKSSSKSRKRDTQATRRR